VRENPHTDLILLGSNVKSQLTSSTQKPRQQEQKTKNNKILPKATVKEHDIVNIPEKTQLIGS
jgi:hypothetical protein